MICLWHVICKEKNFLIEIEFDVVYMNEAFSVKKIYFKI